MLYLDLVLVTTTVDVSDPIVVRGRDVRTNLARWTVLGPKLVLVLLSCTVVLEEHGA